MIAKKQSNANEGPVRKSNMVFNKSFGQHILKNPVILQNMVDKSGVRTTDVVLEIGPGTGNLTYLLLERAKKVIAVEIDPRMVVELNKRFHTEIQSKKLEIIHKDFMTTDLPFFDMCVANVPYQISSPLVFKLLAHRPFFRCAVLMFQREFAMRLVAQPASELYCRLSVNVQFLARCDHMMKVSKNNFKPPPKVESSIVRIEPKNPPPDVNYVEWDGLLRILFTRKNKTVGALFKNKTILKLLLENYKKLNQLQNEESKMEDPKESKGVGVFLLQGDGMEEEKAEDDNEEDEGDKKKKKKEKKGKQSNENDMDTEGKEGNPELKEFKDKISKVLKESGYEEERTNKLKLDDFLKLLSAFNSAGIHFR